MKNDRSRIFRVTPNANKYLLIVLLNYHTDQVRIIEKPSCNCKEIEYLRPLLLIGLLHSAPKVQELKTRFAQNVWDTKEVPFEAL